MATVESSLRIVPNVPVELIDPSDFSNSRKLFEGIMNSTRKGPFGGAVVVRTRSSLSPQAK